jgi:hypothetical protein
MSTLLMVTLMSMSMLMLTSDGNDLAMALSSGSKDPVA